MTGTKQVIQARRSSLHSINHNYRDEECCEYGEIDMESQDSLILKIDFHPPLSRLKDGQIIYVENHHNDIADRLFPILRGVLVIVGILFIGYILAIQREVLLPQIASDTSVKKQDVVVAVPSMPPTEFALRHTNEP